MEQDRLSPITLAAAKKYTDTHGGGSITVQADWSESDDTANDYIKNKPELGDLAAKDDAATTYTPQGSVTITDGSDTTDSVASVTSAGTLPSFSVSEEVLIFDAGALPTTESKTVVTASGARTAVFSGTEATITVS